MKEKLLLLLLLGLFLVLPSAGCGDRGSNAEGGDVQQERGLSGDLA